MLLYEAQNGWDCFTGLSDEMCAFFKPNIEPLTVMTKLDVTVVRNRQINYCRECFSLQGSIIRRCSNKTLHGIAQ